VDAGNARLSIDTPRPGSGVYPIVLPSRRADRSVNVLFIPGPVSTLVDAGPGTPEALEALEVALGALDATLSGLGQLLLTHGHRDHAGGAPEIARRSKAMVLAHPAALDAVTGDVDFWEARRARLAILLAAAGLPDDLARAAVAGQRPPDHRLDPAVARPVHARTRPNLGGRSWKVMATPGHSPDHLAFLDPAGGGLAGGDLLDRHRATRHVLTGFGPDRRPSGAQRLDELVNSWKRVGRLAVDVVWPGHGPVIRAPRVLIARRMAGLRARLREARGAVREGAETVWDVARTLNSEPLDPDDLLGTVGETVALLEWLHDRGALDRERRGQHAVYTSARRKASP
jgi:glyoxylase-like metal-dependent hydrolase (beta-lactamase superfamily II)